jgi:hypothetical protein
MQQSQPACIWRYYCVYITVKTSSFCTCAFIPEGFGPHPSGIPLESDDLATVAVQLEILFVDRVGWFSVTARCRLFLQVGMPVRRVCTADDFDNRSWTPKHIRHMSPHRAR